MMYFDDMQTKYGFNSGQTVPEGADLYRTLYITTMNTLLEKYGSNIRLMAFDGFKNPILIVRVTKEMLGKATWPATEPRDEVWDLIKASGLEDEPPFDHAGNEAESKAHEMMIDDLMEVKVSLPNNLNERIGDYMKEFDA